MPMWLTRTCLGEHVKTTKARENEIPADDSNPLL